MKDVIIIILAIVVILQAVGLIVLRKSVDIILCWIDSKGIARPTKDEIDEATNKVFEKLRKKLKR